MSNRMKRGTFAWYGFDLDGTLALHEEAASIDEVGAPIHEMVNQAKLLLDLGETVKIVTARVCLMNGEHEAQHQRTMIQNWCAEHIGQELEVTNEKDFGMIALYDDRAISVDRNTGRLVREVFREIGQFQGRAAAEFEIKDYDHHHGIESDAYARFEMDCEDNAPIMINVMTGDDDDVFYAGVREARSLAASILRACDEAERAGARTT